MDISPEYYAKVSTQLEGLKAGQRVDLSLFNVPEQRERYVESVKKYIDEYQGYCPIEFSNDYCFVKKIDIFDF